MARVAFVTDELFLPVHNGSASVYAQVAQQRRDAGDEIHAVSFYRSPEKARSPEVREAYEAMFASHLLVPGWNGGGDRLAKLGLALREARRLATGEVFPGNPLLKRALHGERVRLAGWLADLRPDLIYVHKLQALQLAEGCLPPGARISLDLHDDFISKELQYRTCFDVLSREMGGAFRKLYPREFLRLRLGRVDEARSRRTEAALLSGVDELRVASDSEYRQYAARFPAGGHPSVVHAPWPADVQAIKPQAGRPAPDQDFGFIGSEDTMNADALVALKHEIMPRWRARGFHPKLLVAGSVSPAARVILHDYDGVTILGRVEDLADFYSRIRAAIVPLRHGTGVSIKVIEALAYGVPVVSTTQGARGIDPASPGLHVAPGLAELADLSRASLAT